MKFIYFLTVLTVSATIFGCSTLLTISNSNTTTIQNNKSPTNNSLTRNTNINYSKFEKLVKSVNKPRMKRRITEEQFINMVKEKGTLVLDTRSAKKYKLKHVKGAIHLNFSDFTQKSLDELIPNKNTRILIYCNNNFDGDVISLPTKSEPLALNIPTYINLVGYGYKNIYELGPNLDINKTEIEFEGDLVKK